MLPQSHYTQMHLSICVLNSKTITLEVDPHSSVASLKQRLEDLENIPAPLQVISTQDQPLADSESLLALQTHSTTCLCVSLDVSSSFQLRYRVETFSGKTCVIATRLAETVGAVKARVREVAGVDVQQHRLMLAERELEEIQTISEVFVPGKFHMQLAATKGEIGDAAVQTQSTTCNTTQKDTDSHIKYECDIDRPHSISQSTASSDFPIINEFAFAENSDGQLSQIALNRSQAIIRDTEIAEYGDMLLRTKASNGEEILIAVSTHTKVEAVRVKLSQRLCIPVQDVTLVYRGEMLRDQELVASYEMQPEQTVEIIQPFDSYIWAKSKFERVKLPIYDTSAPISALITRFYTLTGSKKQIDWIFYQGKLMNLDCKLSDYFVHSGAVLELINGDEKSLISVSASDKRCHFAIEKGETVARLRELIGREWPCTSESHQKEDLLCAGKNLRTDVLISDMSDSNTQLLREGERLYLFLAWDQHTISVPFNPKTLVYTVKERLSEEVSIPASELSLIVEGTVLSDASYLSALDQAANTVIGMCRRGDWFLMLKPTSGNSVYLSLPSLDLSVESLKAYCEAVLPHTESLWLHETCLDQNQKLADYSVSNGTSLIVFPSNRMEITARTLQRDAASFWIDRRDTISDLKRKIEGKFRIPAVQQALIATDEQLSDSSPVSSIGSSVICLNPHERFAFIVSTTAAQRLIFFKDSDSSMEFVSRVAEMYQLPPHQLVLICGDSEVKRTSERTVSDIRIGTKLQLFTEKDEYLIVRTSANTVKYCPVRPNTSIEEVISALDLKQGSRLLHNYSILYENCCVSDYSLTPFSKINAISPADSLFSIQTRSHGSISILIRNSKYVTVKVLKATLSDCLKFPVSRLSIFVNRNLYGDERGLYASSEMLMLADSDRYIRAFRFQTHSVTVIVPGESRISDLKATLASMFFAQAADLRLVCKNVLLSDDSQSLIEYQLPALSDIVVLLPEDLLVCLRGANRTDMRIAVKNTETGFSLRGTLIAKNWGKYGDWYVSKRRAVKDAEQLSEHSDRSQTVNLTIFTGNESHWEVGNTGGEFFSVILPRKDTSFLALRESVREKTGVSAEKQSYSCVAELGGGWPLSRCWLGEDSILTVTRSKCNYADPTRQFTVCVSHFEDKRIIIKVTYENSIAHIKKRAEFSHIRDDFRLIVLGEIADEDKTLCEYGIFDKIVAMLVLPQDGLATIAMSGGDGILLPFSPTYTVFELKRDIAKRVGFGEDLQRIGRHGCELADTVILSTLGSELQLLLTTKEDLVIVDSLEHSKAVFLIGLSETVNVLKTRIAIEMAIIGSEQKLYFGNRLLQDDTTLEANGVVSGSAVHLITRDDIRVRVKSLFSSPISLFCTQRDNVEAVQKAASSHFRVHYSQILLTMDFDEVDERNFTVLSYAVRTTYLTLKAALPQGEIVVLVEGSKSELFPLRIRLNDTIGNVREKVEEAVEMANIRLFHYGIEMKTEDTVAKAGLVSLSQIAFI